MQTASVVFDSCKGPISVRIFASERMMGEARTWLANVRRDRPLHWQPPAGVDEFTLIMGYQAQMMMVTDVAGRA